MILKYLQDLIERYPPAALIELIAEKLGLDKNPLLPLMKIARGTQERGIQAISLFLESIGSSNMAVANVVTLTTIHQAKGQEWDLVFVVRINEHILPAGIDPTQLEEERRLAYVACTRSKRFLFLSCAQQSNNGDQLIPSRFLDELTLESSAPTKSCRSDIPSPKSKRIKPCE